MQNKNCLGIWMDHSSAQLMDLNSSDSCFKITSKFTFEMKEEVLKRSEYAMHNKEEQLNEAFYKEISEEILKYKHVLLFGPTDAKTELHNFMNKDLNFRDIKFDVEPADKMTDNEKVAFVKSHFIKKLCCNSV